MKTHIYAFGSICRGEITRGSDVDLLACTYRKDNRFDSEVYSIYTHERLEALWTEGNPFAWHLALESKLLFSSDGKDFLVDLGTPLPYRNAVEDCEKFYSLFSHSIEALEASLNSRVFNLSSIFLSIRNIATCYSLARKNPIFSRHSAFMIDLPVPLNKSEFTFLERARILATRGLGEDLTENGAVAILSELRPVDKWMKELIVRVKSI